MAIYLFAVAVASHAASHNGIVNKVKAVRISSVIVVMLATTISFFLESVDITIVGAALRLTLAGPMIYVLCKKEIQDDS